MFSVRLHGRGGQGVVTTAELLAVAAFREGRCAQAFPTFGSERTGAPVTAYCRLDERPIRSHDPVTVPDAVVVQDATLLHDVTVLAGVGPETVVLLNTARTLDELHLENPGWAAGHVLTVPATAIARKHVGKPLPGCPLLGAFAALTGQVRIEPLVEAIRDRFAGELGRTNAAAATAGYLTVVRAARGRAHA